MIKSFSLEALLKKAWLKFRTAAQASVGRWQSPRPLEIAAIWKLTEIKSESLGV
jgi:hypothetical protein